jgi:hypothetical protein
MSILIIINVINIIRIIIDHSHNNQYMTDLHNSITIPPRETHSLALSALNKVILAVICAGCPSA